MKTYPTVLSFCAADVTSRLGALPRWLQRALLLVVAGSTVWLTGCGFHLRGEVPKLPFKEVAFSGPRGAVTTAVMEAIEAQGVRRAPEETPINRTGTNAEGDAPAETDLRIAVSVDQRERQVVASTIAGQVRELDLRVRYAWQAFDGKGQPLTPPIDMVLSQEMSYQESAVLTKEFEQESIYRSLQARMVGQIMRRLAVLPTRPAGATSESPPR